MSRQQLDRVIARFAAMKAGWGADVTLARMRNDLEALTASYAPDLMAHTRGVSIGGVPAEWVSTAASDPSKALLYFHGGGFAVGSVAGTRNLAVQLAEAAHCRVLVLGYRLAPEKPFPAPVEDALAAWRFLRETGGFRAQDLAVGGDSAGGGLALVLIRELVKAGEAVPACGVLLTPWTDLRCEAASYDRNAALDPIANREMAKMTAATYLGENGSALDLRASPTLAPLKGFPPLLVQAAGRDVLLDDARAVESSAKAAGVPVTLDVWPDMIHQWQQYAAELDEGAHAVSSLGFFLRSHLAPK